MGKWRVYNDNIYPFTQVFKEQHIHIRPGEYWEFDDYDEAHQFKFAYSTMTQTPDGGPDPKGYKMMRLVAETAEPVVAATKWISPMDGKVFNSELEMNTYLKANYSDQVFTDDALEQEIIKKRGPGRPPHIKG